MPDRDTQSGFDPKPADGIDDGTVPVPPSPPRPRALQYTSLALGLAAVGAGLMGKEFTLLLLCGLSVLANAFSLLVEGGTYSAARSTSKVRQK